MQSLVDLIISHGSRHSGPRIECDDSWVIPDLGITACEAPVRCTGGHDHPMGKKQMRGMTCSVKVSNTT